MVHEEVVVAIKRFLSWFLPTILGVSTDLAYESEKRKLSLGRIISSITIGCFVGYFVDGYLTYKGIIEPRGFIVAGAGLMSKRFVSFVMKKNAEILKIWATGLAGTLSILFKGKKDE